MSRRIAITPRSLSEVGHPALSQLTEAGYELVFPAPGRQPVQAELMATLPGCVGYLAGVEPVNRTVLEACPHLRVISRNGVGVDNIDLQAAAERGIAVEKALGANTRGVAELALALMLDAARHVSWSDRQLLGGGWKRHKGRELQGRTLGVVGCGAIGRTLGQLAVALGMRVIGHDPLAPADLVREAGIEPVTLHELLSCAEFVSLHCPPSSGPLLDDERLGSLPRGAVVVNTARAELVDESAMLAAIESGQVGVYATDVYLTEPPEMSPLLRHERVIRTPHAGGFTDESVDRATQIAVSNLLRRLESA